MPGPVCCAAMTARLLPVSLVLLVACTGDDGPATGGTDGTDGTVGTTSSGTSDGATSTGGSATSTSATATSATDSGTTTGATGSTSGGSDTGASTGTTSDGGSTTGGACGDGVVDVNEECDDGNTDETDGCLSNCINGAPPILYYPLDTDATNAGSLGNTYDGAANMVTWDAAEKKFGSGAAQITGTGEITIPNTATPLSASSDYTISIWYRGGQAADLMWFRATTEPGGGMHIYDALASGPQITMCYSATPDGGGCGNTGPTTARTWHNVTFRCDGDGLTAPDGCNVDIYLDGELKDSVNTQGNVVFSPNQAMDLVVGNDSAYKIDEVKIFDTVFSDQGQCAEVWGGTWDGGNTTCTLP